MVHCVICSRQINKSCSSYHMVWILFSICLALPAATHGYCDRDFLVAPPKHKLCQRLYCSLVMSFLYSLSLKWYTMEASVTSPLTRSCCATWFALTRHGGLDVVGSYDSFYSLPRFTTGVCHICGCTDFIPSLLFFLRHSVNQCVSRLYCSVVKGVA